MIVAFDIDDTLISSADGSPIYEIIRLVREFHARGHTIVIITARFCYHRDITIAQLREIGLDQYVDLERNIYYTDAGSKVNILAALNVRAFFDDADHNIIDILSQLDKLHPEFKLYHVKV